MKKLLLLLISSTAFLSMQGAPSILDIKHSISDDNIIPPESFETKTRELEENFYLRNFVVAQPDGKEKLGTPAEYEKRLAALPTVIEMPYNSIVGRLIDMYLGRRRGLVADMLALHSYYGVIFMEELEKEGMPLELQYLPVIESAINPNAVSKAGATGLWQFMPGTAKGLGMEVNSLVDERRDPRQASRNAARYLKQLYNIYNDWSLAIAAYNCGPGNVNKAIRRAGGGTKDFWQIYNYLPAETRSYVPAFIAANYVMNYYDKHNIAPTVVKRHLVTDTIHVNKRVHFNQIAEVLNIPVDEIRMLNPQYRQDIIPGNYHPYVLTLPKQQTLSYLMSEDAILAHDADLYAQRTYVEPGGEMAETVVIDETGGSNISAAERQSTNGTVNVATTMTDSLNVTRITHTVGRGESLKDIAKAYGVSATDIKRWNKLRRGKVKEGDVLEIEKPQHKDINNVATLASNTPSRTANAVPEPPRRQERTVPAVPPPPAKKAKEDTKRNDPPAKDNKKSQAKKKDTNKDNKQASSKAKNYTVRRGDSLEKIARANGVTVADLRKANNMKANQERIDIGQKLKIPAKKSKGNNKKSSKKKKKR